MRFWSSCRIQHPAAALPRAVRPRARRRPMRPSGSSFALGAARARSPLREVTVFRLGRGCPVPLRCLSGESRPGRATRAGPRSTARALDRLDGRRLTAPGSEQAHLRSGDRAGPVIGHAGTGSRRGYRSGPTRGRSPLPLPLTALVAWAVGLLRWRSAPGSPRTPGVPSTGRHRSAVHGRCRCRMPGVLSTGRRRSTPPAPGAVASPCLAISHSSVPVKDGGS